MRRVVVVGLILAIALSGCAGRTVQTPETPTPAAAPTSASPTPSPTPTAQAIPLTGVEHPAQPFGGDCERLVTIDELTDAAGTPVVVGAYDGSELDNDGLISTTVNATWAFASLQAGALNCAWHTDDLMISVTAYPGAALERRADATCDDLTSDDGYASDNDCVVTQFVNDTQLIGYVVGPDPDTAQAFATTFAAFIRDSAAAAEPVTVARPGPSTWPLGVDCAIPPVTIDGETWTFEQARIGYGGGPADIFVELVDNPEKDTLYCQATTEGADPLYAQWAVYGGGAWVFDEYVNDISLPAMVDGFDHAAVVAGLNRDEPHYLLMARGENLLSLQGVGDPTLYELSAAFADALDAEN